MREYGALRKEKTGSIQLGGDSNELKGYWSERDLPCVPAMGAKC